MKRRLFALLFILFAATLADALHNPFDHAHDESCSVYVLEQLSLGAALPDVTLPPIVHTYAATPEYPGTIAVCNRPAFFTIRAPPLS